MPVPTAELHPMFTDIVAAAASAVRPERTGQISRVLGLRFDVEGLDLPVGATVRVSDGQLDLVGEVVAVGTGSVTCMPFGDVKGLRITPINFDNSTGEFVHEPNPLVEANLAPTREGVRTLG